MRLVIFTRYPEAGAVKTRLIPALGREGALKLHREMAEHTLRQAGSIAGEIEVRFTGGSRGLMKKWLGEGILYGKQEGRTLGEKLAHAFKEAFSAGHDRVVVIGTDCPGLSPAHIEKAFGLLVRTDLVLGPAADGGYYLIGLRRLYEELLQDITWGSSLVFRQTLAAAAELGLKTACLEKLADVDRPGDLPAAWHGLRRQ